MRSTLHCVISIDGCLDLPGTLRALRRRADLSQRQLAAQSGVPPATIAGIESGDSGNPSLRTVERMIAATGARLAILDVDGSEPVRLPQDDRRDRQLRRYPPHLDVRPVTWRGGQRVTSYGFIRNRRWRDYVRRYHDPARREGLHYEVRMLQPGDSVALEELRAANGDLHPTIRHTAPSQPLSPVKALRYLRDPSLRHWVAEARWLTNPAVRGQILGHVAARVHQRPTGPPALLVVDLGIRPDHRAGLLGIRLVAAVSEEAALVGAEEIVAVAHDADSTRLLRSLGFRRRARRGALLSLPG